MSENPLIPAASLVRTEKVVAIDELQEAKNQIKVLEHNAQELFLDCCKELDPLGLWDHLVSYHIVPYEIKQLRLERDSYKHQLLELKVKLLNLGK